MKYRRTNDLHLICIIVVKIKAYREDKPNYRNEKKEPIGTRRKDQIHVKKLDVWYLKKTIAVLP